MLEKENQKLLQSKAKIKGKQNMSKDQNINKKRKKGQNHTTGIKSVKILQTAILNLSLVNQKSLILAKTES